MRIAQIAPLIESVPPQLYGGTERVVSYLTEELVRAGPRGHAVRERRLAHLGRAGAVLGPGAAARSDNARPRCRTTWSCWTRCGGARPSSTSCTSTSTTCISRCFATSPRRTLTTLHGRLDLPDLPVASTARSRSSRWSRSPTTSGGPARDWHWLRTVHHGLPRDLYRVRAEARRRLSRLPRPDLPREAARSRDRDRPPGRASQLKIAAKVDRVDQSYFDEVIRPLLRDPADRVRRRDRRAREGGVPGRRAALLFPIDWPEPFGLVMIEAMACGTPVIAYRCGSVPEVIEDGVTGFIVDDVDGAVAAVDGLDQLDRGSDPRALRAARFTARADGGRLSSRSIVR